MLPLILNVLDSRGLEAGYFSLGNVALKMSTMKFQPMLMEWYSMQIKIPVFSSSNSIKVKRLSFSVVL